MISAEDDRCVFIKILFLKPGYKIVYLAAGACQYIFILCLKLVLTQRALIPFWFMGVHCKHREIERLIRCRQLRNLVSGKLEQLLILEAPGFFVPLRNQAQFLRPYPVQELIISMLGKIVFTAAEFHI